MYTTVFGALLALYKLNFWLGYFATILAASIPIGRQLCVQRYEWPKASLIMFGLSLLLASLFGPVLIPDETPYWIWDNGAFAGFSIIILGIFCIRWPRQRQIKACAGIFFAALILFAISVVVDTYLHGFLPVPD